METLTTEFMGLRVPIGIGEGLGHPTRYQLDFDQELVGVCESQKCWKFSCVQCRVASGTRAPKWLSSSFHTGPGQYIEEEQKAQFKAALDDVQAHAELHQRMASWYEQLAENPAYKAGAADEMKRGMARE